MKAFRTVLFFLFAFAATASAKSVGPHEEYSVVKNFQSEWYVYDERYLNYIPYIAERHFKIPAHVFFCDLETNLPYDLLIKCSTKGSFLFIEGSLQRELPADEWVIIPIRDLYKRYNKRQIYLTLYGSTDVQTKWAGIGYKQPRQIAKQNEQANGLKILPRGVSPFRTPISFLFILVLGVFTYISLSFPRMFQGFYNLRSFIMVDVREQALFAQKAFNRSNVFFILLVSLLLGLLYLIMQSLGIELIENKWFLQDGKTSGVLLSNFLRITLIIFLSLFLKYFFLVAMGGLFNIGKVVDLHFFKLLQATLVFYSLATLFFIIVEMAYIPLGPEAKSFVFGGLIIFYLLRTVLIFSAINRTMSIPVLYLISYLCIVEVIPIFIGLQLLYQR